MKAYIIDISDNSEQKLPEKLNDTLLQEISNCSDHISEDTVNKIPLNLRTNIMISEGEKYIQDPENGKPAWWRHDDNQIASPVKLHKKDLKKYETSEEAEEHLVEYAKDKVAKAEKYAAGLMVGAMVVARSKKEANSANQLGKHGMLSEEKFKEITTHEF